MKRYVMHTLAAACLLVAAGPALADASSTATFGNVVITLIDLNPTDGIAPSLSFIHGAPANVTGQTLSWGENYEFRQNIQYQDKLQGPLTATTHTEWSSTSSNVMAADNLPGFTTMSAQGAAHSGLEGYGSYLSSAIAPLNQFIVSANTMVTFSVRTMLSASTTMGYNLDADMDEYAFARATMSVSGTVNGNYQFVEDRHFLDVRYDVRDDNTTTGVSDSWNGDMSVTFTNMGATDTTGMFQSLAFSEGHSALWDGVTPVPEPGTYAMMLGGLGLIGAISRRRKAA
jgi:hypothetical protein